jgi:hypothetical protein
MKSDWSQGDHLELKAQQRQINGELRALRAAVLVFAGMLFSNMPDDEDGTSCREILAAIETIAQRHGPDTDEPIDEPEVKLAVANLLATFAMMRPELRANPEAQQLN